jgi:hypothetical protein
LIGLTALCSSSSNIPVHMRTGAIVYLKKMRNIRYRGFQSKPSIKSAKVVCLYTRLVQFSSADLIGLRYSMMTDDVCTANDNLFSLFRGLLSSHHAFERSSNEQTV